MRKFLAMHWMMICIKSQGRYELRPKLQIHGNLKGALLCYMNPARALEAHPIVNA